MIRIGSCFSLIGPCFLFVQTQKQLSENVFIDERRPVLLCDGKLRLQALQDLFNLAVVEMMYGTWSLLHCFCSLFFFLQGHFQDLSESRSQSVCVLTMSQYLSCVLPPGQ